ncbi:hypothetical protein MHM93_14720 [Pseudoalteromonas sp. MM17-2]|uniref:hypothetical protein n=1 Tax=Pseudoalteromonas sp. MM17-2 TaxID=2917753 RepID=UPI001EF64FE4|nr:hypothetical protein [Pseudoalteromonas sp. MM17-2]MCG7545432.1 hypothetical protein [Pseudoalteromonas sp. MM17-2]
MSEHDVLIEESTITVSGLSLGTQVGNLSDEQSERLVDLIEAVSGLSKVTDSGLSRVINAINELHSSSQFKNLAPDERAKKVNIAVQRIDASEINTKANARSQKYQLNEKAKTDSHDRLEVKRTKQESQIGGRQGSSKTLAQAKPQRSISPSETDFNQLKESIPQFDKSPAATPKDAFEAAKMVAEKLSQQSPSTRSSTVEDFEKSANEVVKSNERIASAIEKKSSGTDGMYTDDRGRVRTATGHYASKEDAQKFHSESKGTGSVLRTLGAMFGGESMRGELLGRAFLGSAYGVIEELVEAKEQIQSGLSEREITDFKSAKEYLVKKKDTVKEYASSALSTTRQGLTNTVDGIRTTGSKMAISARKSGLLNPQAGNALSQRMGFRKSLNNPPITEEQYKLSTKKMADKEAEQANQHHGEKQQKMDTLIEEVEDLQLTAGGGTGGGGLIEDMFGFDVDRKKSRGGKYRKGKAGKLGKIANFFRGGSKVAPVMATGALAAGGVGASAGMVSSGGAKAGLMASGKLLGKLIPIAAVATTMYDAYQGFSNEDKQRETFNLKKTDEPDLGHKTAMALGNVADLGGITSGISGWLGKKFESMGFEGAQDAMTFDAGDIAKKIHKRGSKTIASGKGIFSALSEGDFSGAFRNAGDLAQIFNPLMATRNLFSDDEKESSNSANNKLNSNSKEIQGKGKNTPSINRQASEVAAIMDERPNTLPASPNIAELKQEAENRALSVEKQLLGERTVVTKDPEMLKTLKKIEQALVNQKETKRNNVTNQRSVGVNSSQRDLNTAFSDPITERLASE